VEGTTQTFNSDKVLRSGRKEKISQRKKSQRVFYRHSESQANRAFRGEASSTKGKECGGKKTKLGEKNAQPSGYTKRAL